MDKALKSAPLATNLATACDEPQQLQPAAKAIEAPAAVSKVQEDACQKLVNGAVQSTEKITEQ